MALVDNTSDDDEDEAEAAHEQHRAGRTYANDNGRVESFTVL